MDFQNLKTENLQYLVQEEIKRYIINSGLKSGSPIPTEKELSEKLGISRTAIREGLKSLETLGIIEVKPGIGRFIKEFNFQAILDNLPYNIETNIKNFNDVLEVRVCLESWFISKDLNKYTERHIKKLKDILKEMEKQVERNFDEKELIETHSDFHCALYEVWDNKLLINLIKIFSTIQRNLTILHRYKTRNRKEFIALHRRIIESIEKRDPDLARRCMREHFSEAMTWVASQLELKTKEEKGGE